MQKVLKSGINIKYKAIITIIPEPVKIVKYGFR